MKDIRLLNGLFISILVAGAVNAILIYLQIYMPYKEEMKEQRKTEGEETDQQHTKEHEDQNKV